MLKFTLPLALCAFGLVAGAATPRLVPDARPAMKAMKAAPMKTAGQKAPVSRVDIEKVNDWKSIGICRYNDGFISQPYGTDQTAEYTQRVEIEESESNPGLFRVINPYKGHGFLEDYEYDGSADHYMIVDATNPDDVKIPEFFTGVFLDGEDPIYAASDGTNTGKYADGVVTFAEWGLKYRLSEDGAWAVCNWRSTFRLTMPWVADYEFSLDVPQCAENASKLTFAAEIGGDIAKVKYGAFAGQEATDDEMQAVRDGSQTLDLTADKFTVDLPATGFNHIVAVAYDAEGNEQANDVATVLNLANDDSQWTTIGTAVVTEPVISSFFSGYGPYTVEAEVQQHATEKGRYRVVDVFAKTGLGGYTHNSSHKHYIEFDATNPDRVVLATGSTGLDLGYGLLCFSSPAAEALAEGYDLSTLGDDSFGKLVDGVVTFPALTVYTGMLSYYNGYMFEAESDLTIVIPKEHTVRLATSCDSRYGSVVFVDPAAEGTELTTMANSVTVKAVPAEGIEFTSWTDEAGETLSMAPEYTYVGSSDATLTANFGARVKVTPNKLATVTLRNGDAEVVSNTLVEPGTKLSVAVEAVSGYEVKGLMVNDNLMEGNGEFTVAVETSTTVEAVIEALHYAVSLSTEGNANAEIWAGMENDGAPLAPQFNNGDMAGFGSSLALFVYPGLDKNGNREKVVSVTVTTDGHAQELDPEEDLWLSEWKPEDGVLSAFVDVKGPTEVKVVTTGETTSIEAIGADAAEAEWFTVQGVKVDSRNLVPGIYVVRRGNAVTKVAVGL